MSRKTFLQVAGVIFLVIAAIHLPRIVFGVTALVGDQSIPMWASWLAVLVMGFLGYQGLRLAKTAG